MKLTLSQASDLGHLIRSVRKAQGLRQDDTAGAIGVSENFLGKVERGSDSVQWGKLFRVLNELGLRLMLDVPDHLAADLTPKPTAGSIASKKS